MRLRLFSFALLALAGCGEKPADAGQHQPPPPPVGVAEPVVRDHADSRIYTGRVEAISTVELRSLVGGTIVEVLVEDGAAVTAGQELFHIDRAPFEATQARAKADLARAQARHDQAKLRADRAAKLLPDHVISQQDHDDAQAALAAAVAEVAAAEAALVAADLDLTYCSVRAPMAGRIGRVLATQGNIAQGSGPAPGTHLATLVSKDQVYVLFDVDEAAWRDLGPRLTASADGGEPVRVQVGLAGETGYPHEGRVSVIDNRIDSASGSIRVRATVADPDGVILPGAFARVRLQIGEPRPVLLVNERAVQAQLNTRFVYTVDGQGVTAIRPLVLGETVDQYRVVLAGLKAGERIAVTNTAKIFFPGMPVDPQPADMATLELVGAAVAPAAEGSAP